MADTTFASGVVISSDWLNDVNDFVYHSSDTRVALTTSMTAAQVRTAVEAALTANAGKYKTVIPIHPSGPTTEWEIDDEIRIPNNSYLEAEAKWCAGFKLSNAALATQNVLTNILNDRVDRSTLNENITIDGLRINGNGSRTGVGSVGGNCAGNGVGLAGVKYVVVKDCYIYGGFKKHCIDISGAVYPPGGSDTTYPTGMSMYFHVEGNHCIDASDDAITTHSCQDGSIVGNFCFKDWSTTLDADNSNLIEIDEASKRIIVKRNICKGGANSARGIEVKGHSDTPAAQDVLVEGNIISGVCIGICVRHLGHGDGAEPDSPNGRNVIIRDNFIYDIGANAGALTISPNTIEIQSYFGVVIDGNIMENRNNTWPGGDECIFVFSGGNNVRITNNKLYGFATADYGIRISSGADPGHWIMNNELYNSGRLRGISCTDSQAVIGYNSLTFNTTLSANDAGLGVDNENDLIEKFPNYVSGYTTAMRVNGVDVGSVEPFHMSARFRFCTEVGQFVTIEGSNGTFLVGADDEFVLGSGTTDGMGVEVGGVTRISADSTIPLNLRRRTDHGQILSLFKDTTQMGNISTTANGVSYFTTSSVFFSSGSGSPESAVTAPIGSFYTDITNGVAYMKKSGTGNTGWKLVTQAA